MSSKHQPTKQHQQDKRGGKERTEVKRKRKWRQLLRREERERGEGAGKEEGKEAEEGGDEQVEKDVTDWTVVTRKTEAEEDGPDLRQGGRVQSDPSGGEPSGRQSRGRAQADPKGRGRVCDHAWESAEERAKG